VNGISAPATDANGNPIAIVTVTGPASRLSRERLAEIEPRIVDAAAELSRALKVHKTFATS
jgi:IclR family transcriptional regulator, KDG regulon repressor